MIEIILKDFHFIRPLWFLALIPVMIILWLIYKRLNNNTGAWSSIIEPHLLGILSVGTDIKQSKWQFWLLSFASIILIVSLMGPSFYKYPNNTFKLKQTLFIVLDLSPSMNAVDIKPTRLKRSLFALKNLLKKDFEGEVSLIAYAAEPYLISLPTNDKKTILALLDGVNTKILPTAGSRLDLAISYVQDLINKRAKGQNNILLITDVEKVSPQTLNTIKELKKQNSQTSIIAVSTIQGAPIPTDNGFLKINNKIIISKLNENVMLSITNTGNGLYQNLHQTPNAVENYLLFKTQMFNQLLDKQKDKQVDTWVDSGIWFALLLLPFSLLAFRKGYLLTLVPILFLLPVNQAEASFWQDLWLTNNQQAQKYFNNKEYIKAANKFEESSWKASSLYEAKRYDVAQIYFKKLKQTYNEATALAKSGKIIEAVKKYQEIKNTNPNYQNALANIKILKELLKKEQKKSENKKNNKNQKQNKDNKKQKNKDKDKKSNKKKDKLSQAEKEQLKKQGQKKAKKDKEKQQAKKDKEKQQAKKDKKSKKEKTQEDVEKDKKKQQKKAKEKVRSDKEVLNSEKDQKVEQELKKIKTKPYGLLQRKFLIEREYRKQQKSQFYNSKQQQQW